MSPRMRSIGQALSVVAVVGLISTGTAVAQPGLTKQDRQGPVTVALTPVAPVTAGAPLKVRVALDTHSVNLDTIPLERAVVLRSAAGTDIAPAAVEEAGGGGHHRQAVVVFPAPPDGDLTIVVKDVGGIAERTFVWDRAAVR